jgi:hypothetical protein
LCDCYCLEWCPAWSHQGTNSLEGHWKKNLQYCDQARKNSTGSQALWLTAVILATQEAEIRRIAVQNQQRQIVLETLSGKNPSQNGLVEWLKV